MRGDVAGIVIAAVSVAIAAAYSYLTFRILQANQKVVDLMAAQFDAATRPYIVVDVFTFTGSALFKLRIRNLGTSAAQQLRICIDSDFYRLNEIDDEHNLRKVYAFNNPIASFAPRAELVFDLGVSWQIYKDAEHTPAHFNVTTAYEYSGKTVSETTHIDLEMFHHSAANPEPIVAELRDLNKFVEKLASKK